MKTNNVIGPISKEDWYLMRLLKESLKFYKLTDSLKYSKVIEKEERILNKLLTSYINRTKVTKVLKRPKKTILKGVA